MKEQPQVVMTEVGKLKPFAGNPRLHKEDVDQLVKSMKQYGFTNPILAQKGTCRVIAGHGRLLAAQKARLKQVPVIFLDLDDRDATAYTIADNKLAENSAWNFPQLKDLLVDLQQGDFDITQTGFDEAALAEMVQYDPQSRLKDVAPKALKRAWALIGVPIGKYPELADMVEKAGKIEGAVVEVAANGD